MRTVWPRLVAGLAAAGLILSGCGGSPEPKPLPKESKSSPSASPSATPPVMPAAAKKKTKAGAEAFVRALTEHSTTPVQAVTPIRTRATLHARPAPACCVALTEGIEKTYGAAVD